MSYLTLCSVLCTHMYMCIYMYECTCTLHITSHHITSSIQVCMHVHVFDLPCTSQYLVTALAIPYIPSHHFSHRLFFSHPPGYFLYSLTQMISVFPGITPLPSLYLSLNDFCIPPLSLPLPPSLPVSLPDDFCIPPLPTPSFLGLLSPVGLSDQKIKEVNFTEE